MSGPEPCLYGSPFAGRRMERVLGVTLVVAVLGSFLPSKMSPLLPLLFVVWGGAWLWRVRQTGFDGPAVPLAMLLAISLLSFLLNEGTSVVNYLIFILFYFGPWSIVLVFGPGWNRAWRTRTVSLLVVVLVVQAAVGVFQYARSHRAPDLVRGTTFSAHNLCLIALTCFILFVRGRGLPWPRLLGAIACGFLVVVTSFGTLYLVASLAACITLVLLATARCLGRKVALAAWGPPLAVVCLTLSGGWLRDFGLRVRQMTEAPESPSPAGVVAPTGDGAGRPTELPMVRILGLSIVDTSALSQKELNAVRDKRPLVSANVKLACSFELLATIPHQEPHALALGLGPGNVNSRAANLRSRTTRGLDPIPFLGEHRNRYTEYYVHRWENQWTIQEWTRTRSSILEEPFGTWQTMFAELGLAGVVLFSASLVLGWRALRPPSFTAGGADCVLIFLIYAGLAFFWDIFAFPDLMMVFWIVVRCLDPSGLAPPAKLARPCS